jgi:hypothetical protein
LLRQLFFRYTAKGEKTNARAALAAQVVPVAAAVESNIIE